MNEPSPPDRLGSKPSRSVRSRASGRSSRSRAGVCSGGVLLLAACSLQNFDELSDGAGGFGANGGVAGTGANGGVAETGGAGGDPAGTGGTDGTAGSAGDGVGGTDTGDAGTRPNLLIDPGFEGGHLGWVGFGTSTILDVDGEGRGGSRCISSTDRSETFEGPARNVVALVEAARTYWLEAWVRLPDAQPVSLTLKTACQDTPDSYAPIVSVVAGADQWTRLAGQFTAPTCALLELTFYLEGPASGVSFYIDDVAMYLLP